MSLRFVQGPRTSISAQIRDLTSSFPYVGRNSRTLVGVHLMNGFSYSSIDLMPQYIVRYNADFGI